MTDLRKVPVEDLTLEQLGAEYRRTEYTRETVAHEEEPWNEEDADWCRYLDVKRELARRN